VIDHLVLRRHRRDTSGNRGRAGGHDNQILGLGRCELKEERSFVVTRVWKEMGRGERAAASWDGV